ncbi:MAG: P27 family phage terminase small subunit [Acidobacteria bacterium]|nr:P27 family phage terminase small subunit [Acidobacteriota bacterium]
MKNSEKTPKPPQNLSLSARKAWKTLILEYQIEDAAGLRLLGEFCHALDRAEEARAKIRDEGTTFKDRFGQLRENPSVAVERGSVQTMLACLKSLNLDLEPLQPRPGRPPGK